MLLSVDRHLVQTIVPGTRLTVVGIYSVYQASTTYDESRSCFVFISLNLAMYMINNAIEKHFAARRVLLVLSSLTLELWV